MPQIQHIGRLFRITEHSLMQRLQKQHTALGLTSSQGYVLGYLMHRSLLGETPIYPKDVEKHFNVKHSSVSGVLQRLEAKGFLNFAENPDDRRCKQILLTDKAMQVHAEIEKYLLETEAKILSGMSEEESKQFIRLLTKAAMNLTGDDLNVPPPLFPEEDSSL